jgi:CheY-like chemotaxis protein
LTALLDTQDAPAYPGRLAIAASTPANAFQAELGALTRHQDVVELGELLHNATRMVQALADQKQVTLHYQRPLQPISITAPSIAKEMLIQLLSALVQQSGHGQILVIRTRQEGEHAEVLISGGSSGGSSNHGDREGDNSDSPQAESAGFAWENPLLQNALLMAQLLEMTSVVRPPQAQKREIIIRFNALPTHAGSRPILIVEDNPGVSELYQRYLQGSPWRPTLLANPAETLSRAQELHPAAIILDVLMPETDGWSVLQTLRATPELARIPVIICSVINDPELATALGAAASLKKPLSRLELMEALHTATQGTHVRR